MLRKIWQELVEQAEETFEVGANGNAFRWSLMVVWELVFSVICLSDFFGCLKEETRIS